ncbi:flagellar assembly protein FliH [Litchfieldia salsa]|uniref:Flagellar assembly protein FliH n=1 Tax=Litchfieldia salsa TaxID=930152 RepID=A0A1H0R8T0_9BACI|nr:flagellar assembly protein FliH [Litchfieldia salsa]SDP25466.1 flagellar assembly protein FliH [Litchfieldia salsa]
MSNVIKSYSSVKNDQPNRIITLKTLISPITSPELNEQEQQAVNEIASSIVNKAKAQADTILARAEEEYQQHKEHLQNEKSLWVEEKKRLIEEAKKEGFEAGYIQGQQAGFEEYQRAIFLGNEIVNQAKADSLSHIDTAEELILALSLKISEKIIGQHLENDQSSFISLVKNGIKEVKEHSQISISVNPEYFQLLLNNKEELMTIMNKSSDIYIYANHEIEKNGCIIESSFGRVDASVDSQLGEIKEKLLSLLMEE